MTANKVDRRATQGLEQLLERNAGSVKCYLIEPENRTISVIGLADLEDSLLLALSTEDYQAPAFNAVRFDGHVLVVGDDSLRAGLTPFRHRDSRDQFLGGRALVFAADGPYWVAPTVPIENVAEALTSFGAGFTVGPTKAELIGSDLPPRRSLPAFAFSGKMQLPPAEDAPGTIRPQKPPAFSFKQLFKPKVPKV